MGKFRKKKDDGEEPEFKIPKKGMLGKMGMTSSKNVGRGENAELEAERARWKKGAAVAAADPEAADDKPTAEDDAAAADGAAAEAPAAAADDKSADEVIPIGPGA